MPNSQAHLCVVLVEPSLPENIGAVARVMNNFGISNLRLVTPCNFQNPAVQRTAAHSQSILQNALCFQSLQNAVDQSNLVIGATARPRNRLSTPIPLPSLPAKLPPTQQNIALVFGRESSGLTNRELSCCHLLLTIPTNAQNPSLNLAQAVGLTNRELSCCHLLLTIPTNAQNPSLNLAQAVGLTSTNSLATTRQTQQLTQKPTKNSPPRKISKTSKTTSSPSSNKSASSKTPNSAKPFGKNSPISSTAPKCKPPTFASSAASSAKPSKPSNNNKTAAADEAQKSTTATSKKSSKKKRKNV